MPTPGNTTDRQESTAAEIGDYWLVLDPDWLILFTSQTFSEILDSSPLVGQHLGDLLAAGNQLPVTIAEATGADAPVSMSLVLRASGDRVVTLDTRLRALYTNQGMTAGWLLHTVAFDQQTLDLASELAQLQERFSQLVLCNHTGLLVISHDGRIRFANPAARSALGRSHSQLLGGQFGIPSVAGSTELDILRANGELGIAEITANPSQWQGQAAWLVMLHDITERKRAEEALRYHAEHDTLSGLANRALLHAGLERMLANARRQRLSLALIYLDLNRFKTINDTLGHSIGDLVLIEAAQRLRRCTRDADLVARLGGDEFCIVIDIPHGRMDALAVAEKIHYAFTEPYLIDEHRLHAEASIGIACFPGDGETTEILLRNADAAMYEAKRRGNGRPAFYRPELTVQSSNLLDLETRLREALPRGEMRLRYQPQVRLADLALSGCEALLRWCSSPGRQVWPGRFIPVLESMGLILEVGDWVLSQACKQLLRWQAEGVAVPTVAVNLSPLQLEDEDLVARVAALLESLGLGPGQLVLEVTESAVMRTPERARAILGELRGLGVGLHLDDFGTGHSSLSLLDRFPFDTLKIDQRFIRKLTQQPRHRQLVQAILSMAEALGMRTVAEGVESVEQLEILRELGCHEAQGFFFSRPLTPGNLARLASADSLDWLVARRQRP